MKFVKLTADDGAPVFVNPDAVDRVAGRDIQGGGSALVVSHTLLHVREAPEEVARLLEERPPWREVTPTKMPSHGTRS